MDELCKVSCHQSGPRMEQASSFNFGNGRFDPTSQLLINLEPDSSLMPRNSGSKLLE